MSVLRDTVLALVLSGLAASVTAQEVGVRGLVRARGTGSGIGHALVTWGGHPASGTLTGSDGQFRIARRPGGDRLLIMAIGFRPDTVFVGDQRVIAVELEPAPISLAPLVVAAARAAGARIAEVIVRDLNATLKTPQSSQELLRVAPGLVIAQHGGGGKAEQIFLRGFDADHGTDVAVSVDDVPVNLVSHAHGQGYADLHFVIPEVVEYVEVRKGGHDPRDGNLATAGAISLVTKDRLDGPTGWVRAGNFQTAALGALVPFGGNQSRSGGYLGLSAQSAEGPFERPQGHRRWSGFGKWTRPVTDNVELVASVSGYGARWDASGQVPDRAVRSGAIGRFGSIDPTEGGRTSRADLSVGLRSRGGADHPWQIRAFATRYRLDLYSNFTFFLADSLAGDGIGQFDDRTVVGGRADWSGLGSIAGMAGRLSAGFAVRADFASIELARQTERRLTGTTVASDISEQNAGVWFRQELRPATWLGADLGLRADLFRFGVRDRTTERGGASGPVGQRWAGRVSPKVSISAELGAGVATFAAASASFHSNDARDVVIAGDSINTLPRATTFEVGLRHTSARGSLALGLWQTDLASELVFVGDEGATEPSGRTRRTGIDLEARAQLLPWLWADADLNLVRGRLRDEPLGARAIPLAPTRTATVGLVARGSGPFGGTIRIRHIGDRPANESGSITALGVTLAELATSWRVGRWSVSIAIDNLFNVRWNEAQFATTSRLRGERVPVAELHYTPGLPRRVELGLRVDW